MRQILAPFFAGALTAGCHSSTPSLYLVAPSSDDTIPINTAVDVRAIVWDHQSAVDELVVEAYFGNVPIPMTSANPGSTLVSGTFTIDHTDELILFVRDPDGHSDGAHVRLCVEGDDGACTESASAEEADSGE